MPPQGSDGIEPDDIDGYANESGFALTYGDQLAYNCMLAEEAHRRRTAIGPKNDTAQVDDLVDDLDFAVVVALPHRAMGRWAVNHLISQAERDDTAPSYSTSSHFPTSNANRPEKLGMMNQS